MLGDGAKVYHMNPIFLPPCSKGFTHLGDKKNVRLILGGWGLWMIIEALGHWASINGGNVRCAPNKMEPLWIAQLTATVLRKHGPIRSPQWVSHHLHYVVIVFSAYTHVLRYMFKLWNLQRSPFWQFYSLWNTPPSRPWFRAESLPLAALLGW